MASHDYDIGIIGGGAAGLTITAGAARLGARTLLIEKEPLLGGDCLHTGCVPSKTLIRTARVCHAIRQSSRYGLPAAEMGPVDFSRVAERIREVIARIQEHDSVERFCRLGAEVRFGRPEFTDEHTILLDGERLSARTWVIATGSSPAPPRQEFLNRITCLTNRDLFTLPALPSSMIILGAGPIAMEMAQAFCRLGTTVDVVQRSGQILSKEDRDMADLVMAAMAEEGVRFHLDATVVDAGERGGRPRITIEDREGARSTLEAEAVLLAQGRIANTDTLGLAEISLDHDGRGIAVDSRMRTNHRHIYAAGDVTGRYQFTHAAGYEGGIVVSNAIFRLPRKADYTWMPWCTYTDPELASIGMNEKRAAGAGIGYTVWSEEFAANDRALTEGSGTGRLKMLLNEREKVIGVQIAGPRAGELISEWAVILGGRVKLSTLAGLVHPYPTLSEINKRVAGTVLSTRIFSDRVRKGLRFFFRLKGPAGDPCSRNR
ncbi:MAG TPA: FAD-dependent oxidoreductase [Desulfobulbus sp.]|nr:FAD-dependent oxidoreductase [Desulfobulbus sp.]